MMTQRLTTVAGHAFIVTDAVGNVAPNDDGGLFVADTRFLSRYELRLTGSSPLLLGFDADEATTARIYATNVDLPDIPDHSLEVSRQRQLRDSFDERITLTNRGYRPIDIEVTLAVDADFADIFEVRGMLSNGMPRRARRRASVATVTFRAGQGKRRRLATVHVDPAPRTFRDGLARFPIALVPGVAWTLDVRVEWTVPAPEVTLPVPLIAAVPEEPLTTWLRQAPELSTDDRDLDLAYRRSIRDLSMLELPLSGGEAIPAAGIPWYLAIFGRDSAITSLQTLLLGQRFAEGTLRTLAAYQAEADDAFRDAEPGKMPHEIRFGPLAESGAIPHTRYYGSIDATPLWLVLLAETVRWTGGQALARELLPFAERALRWIDEGGDRDRDGLIEYQTRSSHGLANQAWKDSWDSVRFADGRFAEPPIAPVEAQGYVYAAKRGMADLYDQLGRKEDAVRLRAEAARLKELVQAAFWMPGEGFYALALDGRKRQVDSITSNPGHLLWSGLPDEPFAGQVVDRLTAPDCFTGWGIRTMASSMGAYSPISYHNGSVWPHDTALVMAGFRRYGYAREAVNVAGGLIAASRWFDGHRLPELFCGYDRAETSRPVTYPVACSPQAWAAGSIVQIIQEFAGITAQADRLGVDPLPHGRTLRLRDVPFRGERCDVVGEGLGPS